VRPLLRAELLKLRTTRTFVALAGTALLLSLLLITLFTLLQDNWVEQDVRELFTGDFTGLFILLLGVIGMAGEWRHRTITSTVLAAPNRLRLLAAKTIAYAVAGALISLVVTLVIMAVATTILSARDLPTLGLSQLADGLWRNLIVSAFLGAFGVCIGGLLRNQIVAMVALLILLFGVEPTILAVAPEIGQYGPTSGAPNGVLQLEAFGEDSEILSPPVALLVLAGWFAAFFAAAAALLQKRDLV